MICSVFKKGLLGAALGAGALYLAFGTSAPSYVRTAFHRVRHTAKDSVPVQFEIERAREEIANLGPAIIENRETLARAEVDVEYLEREIKATRGNLAEEKGRLLSLREGIKNGEFRLTGRRSESRDAIEAEMARRLDHYRAVNKILEEKEATLKARQKTVDAARKQLVDMEASKRTLQTRLDGIQAQLEMLKATESRNEFTFDDSALARAKQTVAELEKRLDVKTRLAEMEGRFSDSDAAAIEPGRDVVKEIDTEFGAPVKGTEHTTSDKSL